MHAVPPALQDMQTGERDLRGLLVIGHGHTLADTYQMLMTEHQLCPVDYWHLVCVHPHGETIVDLFNRDPQAPLRSPSRVDDRACVCPIWSHNEFHLSSRGLVGSVRVGDYSRSRPVVDWIATSFIPSMQSDMMELLPEVECDLLVKNCPQPPGVLSGVIKSRRVPRPQSS